MIGGTSVAKKYAVSFINLYSQQFSISEIESLYFVEKFLKKYRYFYLSLRIPSIKLEKKKEAVKMVVSSFKLKKPLLTLMNVLLETNRIEILDKVLRQIRFEYEKRNNVELFHVVSSHELSTPQKKIMVKLIKSMSNAIILTKFLIDPKLIVGLRIESKTLLWERSIKKELLLFSKTLAKKGIQW